MLFSLAFTIPFPFIFSSVAIIALLLVWLLQLNVSELAQNIRQRKALWPWLLYFLMFALSYFYSDNKSQSLLDIQIKLGLLIFPLTIGAGRPIGQRSFETILLSFTMGITIVALICISYAFITYSGSHDMQAFFYNALVNPIRDSRAVYMAWYTLFSLSALLLFPWQVYFKRHRRITWYALIAFHTLFFILLSSKTLILLFFILVTPIYLEKNLKHTHIARWKIAVLAAVVAGLFSVLFFTNNPVKQRYQDVIMRNDLKKAWLKDYTEVDESKLSNLTIRVMAWRIGIENVIDHNLWLTGAGNGDAQDLQNRKMDSYNVQNWDRDYFDNTSELYNVNLHNMFLQSLLMIGLPGLAIFILIIFSSILNIKKNLYKRLFFVFHITAFAFMMQESSLQTQAGVVYYGFFTQIFWNIYYTAGSNNFMKKNFTESKKK